MEEQFNNNNDKSELWNLSVKDLFYKYVRFIPLFLLSVALALLTAFAYLRYATRIYSSAGTMRIKSEQPNSSRNDKAEELITGNNTAQNIQTEIEILKSKPLMTRVVNKLNLQFSYTAKGKIIKDLNVYKQTPFMVEAFEIADSSSSFSLAVKFIDENKFSINNEKDIFSYDQVFKNSNGVFRMVKIGRAAVGTEYRIAWRPAETVAAELTGGLKVQPKTPGTGIVAVGMQATNGQMAADIVNNLMVQYDSMTVEQNNYSTDQMLSFIDSRLVKLKHELDSIQFIELDLRQKGKLFNVETQSDDYLDKLKEANKAISTQEIMIDAVNNVDDYIKDKKNQYSRVVPSSLGLEDVTLNELVSGYNRAQLERQMLLDANIPPANPAVRQAEGVIEKQRENLTENLRNIRLSYLDVITTLRKNNGLDEVQLETLPYKIKDLVEVQRQISTKLVLYNLLEQKREEAAISRASTVSNSNIIDKATPSNVPVKPNKTAIQIIAVLIGLGLPALIIFMAEVFNDKISTRYDIEKITKAAIIGEIGHSYSDQVLIVNKTSRSMVAEQFRIIRSNLQYVLNKNERPVIMVTSSFSGEGKSYISTNMGAVLALAGKKTIILEFDIRKPKVLSGLGMRKKEGISNYLVGKAELKDLVTPVPEIDNLFVLACGPIPPNPSELLLDIKVEEMFEWLRQRFDVIVIDTAPVGMVSDAMTLGKFADCTLYLVRQGHTYKKQVTLIDEVYKEKKLPKVNIVINDVRIKPGYGYYGYGRYGYGYGYGQGKKGNYYEEETPSATSFEKFLQ
ncbi:MAG TPA: polysaccharide biosynthesis tyrosine autokinase, partial [Chitinophagaceae bacterium]|nr:polysaccharide biosynthesis tyrosine autokinase [Chitinophagaceae bacterium]